MKCTLNFVAFFVGTMSQTHFFVMVRITHWFCLKNPFEVKIASVTIAKACAKAYEGHALELACKENQVISEIKFASFGVPEGECGSFKKGHCESSDTLSIVKRVTNLF